MGEYLRLFLSLGLAGLALTLAGAGWVWSMNEARRLRRSLTRVLGEPPHALIVAHGRGKAVGFNFTTNQMAVAWDAGAWCLIYRLEELIGAELAVDGQVLARVYRGEPRRALDSLSGADSQVRLRLVFDDMRHPDFVMDLWLPEDERRKGAMTSAEAVSEANRWVARVEAVLRRPTPRRDPPIATPAPPPPRPAQAAPAATFLPPEDDEPPPWADEDDEPEAIT